MMMYIEKIIIENFQSHKYTEIDFVNGLNALVGESNSGKTAVFRALKWVLYNEPLGDYFIREGESSTRVTLILSTGYSIVRYRTRSKNGYELIDVDGSVEIYEGFGSTVPEEITNVTRMVKVDFTSSENRALNLAEQLESAFLISEKPSVRASAIGRLVGVDALDDAVRLTARDLRAENQKYKALENREVDTKEKLESYSHLDALGSRLSEFEDVMGKIEEHKEKIRILNLVKTKHDEILYELNLNKKLLDSLNSLNSMIETVNTIEKYYINLRFYSNTQEKLNQIERDMKSINAYVQGLKSLEDAEHISANLNRAFDRIKSLSVLKEKHDAFQAAHNSLSTQLDALSTLDSLDAIQVDMASSLAKWSVLNRLNLAYAENRRNMKKGQSYISRFSGVDKSTLEESKIHEANSKLKTLLNIRQRYVELHSKILNEKENLKAEDSSLNRLLDEYGNYLLETKVCPTCSTELDEVRVKDIVEKLGV